MKYLTFILPLFLFMTACGGGGDAQTEATQNDSSQQVSQASDVRTIHIYGINKMKYVVKESSERIGTGETVTASDGSTYLLLENIKADAGEKLRIKLTTISTFAANAMSHDWVLLKQGADPAAYSVAAMKAKANDYFPADKADLVIIHTDMASGGETVEVTFTVPEKTGNYDYLCAFPAHYTAGMKGKLIVE